MLPLFPPLLQENDALIVVEEPVPDPPPLGGPVSILTIERFRGLTAQNCHDVIATLNNGSPILPNGEDLTVPIRDCSAEFRVALSVREHYADYSFHPALTMIAHELATVMCTFVQVPIPPERFPTVRVGSAEEFLQLYGTPCNMNYCDHPSNSITVHAQNIRDDGNFPPTFYEGLGEELGHFLRAEIRREVGLPERLHENTNGWVNSWLVEEFYGYTGRRILQEATRGHPLEPILFPSGESESFIALPELRSIRMALRRWFSRARWFPSVRRERRSRRKDLLTHARGYHFAQNIDMTQIHDWYAFFALSEDDIRRRFFRDDPDYSNL